MYDDFKGFLIDSETIKKYGIKDALIICAYKNKVPNLTKAQERKARRFLGKTNYTIEQIKDMVISSVGSKVCEWCEGRCYILESHHYPIPKREKGTEVVNICGKCHSDFHDIERNNKL